MCMNLLKAYLLHIANRQPFGVHRNDFYDLKHRLLQRYGRFTGHQIQEIRKDCWGERRYDDQDLDSDGYTTVPCGPNCKRCRGTGIYDIRWVRLERWEFCKYVFHVPAGDTRIIPSPYPPKDMIRGRIEHGGDGRSSAEAAMWLYVLCGEWRLWWRCCCSSFCTCGWYPMLHAQRIVTHLRCFFSRATCFCGKRFWTWGSGWCVCPKCRNTNPDEMPF